jgi:hypothetical protein
LTIKAISHNLCFQANVIPRAYTNATTIFAMLYRCCTILVRFVIQFILLSQVKIFAELLTIFDGTISSISFFELTTGFTLAVKNNNGSNFKNSRLFISLISFAHNLN